MINLGQKLTRVSLTRSISVARQDVGAVLEEQFTTAAESDDDPDWIDGVSLVAALTLGSGKRVRPTLCHLGWSSFGGAEHPGIVRVAAALEMFHAFALIHDDVMDRSDTRRGSPTLHVELAARHQQLDWGGNAGRIGDNAAILWGDLCLVWADDLFHSSALPNDDLQRALPYYQQMRSEVLLGQYLDIKGGATGPDLAGCFKILLLKSARYTVERPLQIGAALAGAGLEDLKVLSRYGIAVGEAFQLRDDILGVFGDGAVTGKSALTDLRDGKATVLMAYVRQAASTAQIQVIDLFHGNANLDAAGAERLREIIVETGGLRRVEQIIDRRTEDAIVALGGMSATDGAREALEQMAWQLSRRTR